MQQVTTIKHNANLKLFSIIGLIISITLFSILKILDNSHLKLEREIFIKKDLAQIEIIIAAQTTEELLKSKKSLESLIIEHSQKLADYQIDPDKFDNKNKLKDKSKELRDKLIKGRIAKLEKEIEKFKKLISEINQKLTQNGN